MAVAFSPFRRDELRAFLRHGGDVITETWSYQLHP